MSDLKVNVENMCAFVLTDADAEAWFMKDDFHKPVLDLSRSRIDHSLGAATELDLTGAIVTFGAGPDANNVAEFSAAPSYLAGNFQDGLVNLQQIFPTLLLESTWIPGHRDRLANDMAARVFLSGGDLTPKELLTTGGRKQWQIGKKITQQLVNETEFVYASGSNSDHWIVINFPNVPQKHTWKLLPDANGNFLVTLGAKNNSGQATLMEHMGVVFVQEFEALNKCLDLGTQHLAIPFTYWPDYNNQTDPNGGPCPECVLNLMAKPPALVQINLLNQLQAEVLAQ